MSDRTSLQFACAFGVVTATMAGSVQAATALPDAVYSGNLFRVNISTLIGPRLYPTEAGLSSISNNAILLMQGHPFAVVSATTSESERAFKSSSNGSISYSFRVGNVDNGEIIPIQMDTVMSAYQHGGGYATARMDVFGYTSFHGYGPVISKTLRVSPSENDSSNFNGTLSFSAYAGRDYLIRMTADAQVTCVLSVCADLQASAYVDPFIRIDSSYANAANYPILFSSDIANGVPTVAEPATWSLLIAGFGLTGSAVRRRRFLSVAAGRA